MDRNWGNAERPVFSLWDQTAQDLLQVGRDEAVSWAGAKFTNRYWEQAYGYLPMTTALATINLRGRSEDWKSVAPQIAQVEQSVMAKLQTAVVGGVIDQVQAEALLDHMKFAVGRPYQHDGYRPEQ